MSGSYVRAELLPDRVRAHYHLQKPFGIPDENGTREVLYSEIADLPFPPPRVGIGDIQWSEEIDVSAVGETIVFLFDSFAETDMGPNEHVLYGPYRKPIAKAPVL